MKHTLEQFAKNFVKSHYQTRCIHDALKKPNKLMAKICHKTSEVFDNKYKDNSILYEDDADCYFWELTGHMQKTTWSVAMETVEMGGGGYLIIELGGNKFYAQSEGQPANIYMGCYNDEI